MTNTKEIVGRREMTAEAKQRIRNAVANYYKDPANRKKLKAAWTKEKKEALRKKLRALWTTEKKRALSSHMKLLWMEFKEFQHEREAQG